MTRNAAAVIGRTKDLGTLEPGKLGDLVILDGDPLADSSDRLCTKNTSWALIERPYSCAPQAVGAVYDRPGFFVQSPGRGCRARGRQGEASIKGGGLGICLDLRPSPAASPRPLPEGEGFAQKIIAGAHRAPLQLRTPRSLTAQDFL